MLRKINPLKLNKLQLRTLAIAQLLATSSDNSYRDELNGDATILYLPTLHGDHVHIGGNVIKSGDISGFTNPSVWKALERKGLARNDLVDVALTDSGLSYNTGVKGLFNLSADRK